MKLKGTICALSIVATAVIVGTGFTAMAYLNVVKRKIDDGSITGIPDIIESLTDSFTASLDLDKFTLVFDQGDEDYTVESTKGIYSLDGQEVIDQFNVTYSTEYPSTFEDFKVLYKIELSLKQIDACPINKYAKLSETIFEGEIESNNQKVAVPLSFEYVDKPATVEEYESLLNDFETNGKNFTLEVNCYVDLVNKY